MPVILQAHFQKGLLAQTVFLASCQTAKNLLQHSTLTNLTFIEKMPAAEMPVVFFYCKSTKSQSPFTRYFSQRMSQSNLIDVQYVHPVSCMEMNFIDKAVPLCFWDTGDLQVLLQFKNTVTLFLIKLLVSACGLKPTHAPSQVD